MDAFKLELSYNDGVVGWLGQDSDEWAIVSPEPNALILEEYLYEGVTYYRIKNTDRYMSVSRNGYVGFYSWGSATGFTVEDGHIKSNYNGQYFSYTLDDEYVHADTGLRVLDISFVGVLSSVN